MSRKETEEVELVRQASWKDVISILKQHGDKYSFEANIWKDKAGHAYICPCFPDAERELLTGERVIDGVTYVRKRGA